MRVSLPVQEVPPGEVPDSVCMTEAQLVIGGSTRSQDSPGS